MDGITDSTDVSFSKLQEIVKDREAFRKAECPRIDAFKLWAGEDS